MSSLIFRTAARFLLPLLLVFSVILLLRGHNEPGGGFVGGLVAAAAFATYAMAYGSERTRGLMRVGLHTYIGVGLLAALSSGLFALIPGTLPEPGPQAFLTGWWPIDYDAGFAHITAGTPLVFDVGVYLTVVGVVTMMVFNLAETAGGRPR